MQGKYLHLHMLPLISCWNPKTECNALKCLSFESAICYMYLGRDYTYKLMFNGNNCVEKNQVKLINSSVSYSQFSRKRRMDDFKPSSPKKYYRKNAKLSYNFIQYYIHIYVCISSENSAIVCQERICDSA